MAAAVELGANIIIVTDYDLSGVNLASKCTEDIPWVTMNVDTLEYFGLVKDKRIVVRATNTKLIDHIEEIIGVDERFQNLDIEFLKTSRIEINAVIAAVGDVRFWKFIMDKLQELYPTRNYNRAIELPSKDTDADETDLYPIAIRKLIRYVREVVDDAVAETDEKIKSEQENIEGFLEVAKRKQENKDLVIKTVAENEDIKKIETLAAAAELCDSYGMDITTGDDGGCY
jgi:hypothetical protein